MTIALWTIKENKPEEEDGEEEEKPVSEEALEDARKGIQSLADLIALNEEQKILAEIEEREQKGKGAHEIHIDTKSSPVVITVNNLEDLKGDLHIHIH